MGYVIKTSMMNVEGKTLVIMFISSAKDVPFLTDT